MDSNPKDITEAYNEIFDIYKLYRYKKINSLDYVDKLRRIISKYEISKEEYILLRNTIQLKFGLSQTIRDASINIKLIKYLSNLQLKNIHKN